jgi:hypothetical protein
VRRWVAVMRAYLSRYTRLKFARLSDRNAVHPSAVSQVVDRVNALGRPGRARATRPGYRWLSSDVISDTLALASPKSICVFSL